MKKLINLGNSVDDGTGDYLRRGGEAINSNMNEVYQLLGDENKLHPAGAWQIFVPSVSVGNILNITFGDAYAINTTNSAVIVNLPKGTSNDYGKVVKIRDVWSSWGTNNITVNVSNGDTIKGSPLPVTFFRDFQDLEFVYTTLGRWEYVDNKLVSKMTSSEVSSVVRMDFVATEGQTDFTDIFTVPYNINNFYVYKRGNLLNYGIDLTDDSDYGSIPCYTNVDPNIPCEDDGSLVPLDTKSVRLREPCIEGDTIVFVSFLDDISIYRSSYISKTIRVYEKDVGALASDGQIVVDDLKTKKIWNFKDFGFADRQFNPVGLEVLINGRQLTKSGQSGLPTFHCENNGVIDTEYTERSSCELAGFVWVESGIDFSPIQDENGLWNLIKIYHSLDNGDYLTVRWYNNQIGTTLEIDDILEYTDDRYLNSEYEFNIHNRIRYNDYSNPNPETFELDTTVEQGPITEMQSLLGIIYPVGSLYFNANNPNNPADYMGFGTWVRYGEGQFIVGWSSKTDPDFSYYHDSTGVDLNIAGGVGGSKNISINKENIPTLESEDKVLISDKNGTVIIGSCVGDPEDDGPAALTYREDILKVNADNISPANIKTIPPYITVYTWLRLA